MEYPHYVSVLQLINPRESIDLVGGGSVQSGLRWTLSKAPSGKVSTRFSSTCCKQRFVRFIFFSSSSSSLLVDLLSFFFFFFIIACTTSQSTTLLSTAGPSRFRPQVPPPRPVSKFILSQGPNVSLVVPHSACSASPSQRDFDLSSSGVIYPNGLASIVWSALLSCVLPTSISPDAAFIGLATRYLGLKTDPSYCVSSFFLWAPVESRLSMLSFQRFTFALMLDTATRPPSSKTR